MGEPEPEPERRSLGLLGGSVGNRPPAAGARGNGLLLGGASALLGKRKAAAGCPAADQENAPGGGLDVFVDEEFSGPSGAPATAPPVLFQPAGRCVGEVGFASLSLRLRLQAVLKATRNSCASCSPATQSHALTPREHSP